MLEGGVVIAADSALMEGDARACALVLPGRMTNDECTSILPGGIWVLLLSN